MTTLLALVKPWFEWAPWDEWGDGYAPTYRRPWDAPYWLPWD